MARIDLIILPSLPIIWPTISSGAVTVMVRGLSVSDWVMAIWEGSETIPLMMCSRVLTREFILTLI